MPKQGINVRVTTLDTELEFTILPKTTGQVLFDQILTTIGLREKWYFGLQYTDTVGSDAWLKLEKKVSAQNIKKEPTLQFKFRVKFYPENVADEIIQSQTLRLLYLQVKQDILGEKIYCSAEKAVLLSSYAAQAKYGNQEEGADVGYLANDNILPKSVVSEHKLSREEWEEKIASFHAKHKGMSREDAMMEYLKKAQDLETFGITYYDITNKKGTELLLGVDALGVNVYNKGDIFNPKINFPWSEINRISYESDKFLVKLNDKKTPNFVGICKSGSKNKKSKKIYDLASGNHEMYMRRRRPDSLEVQQMKSQKKDEAAARAKERAELNREIAARAHAEKMREEMEAKFKKMEEDMKKREKDLEEAQENIRKLEEQLREIQEAKVEMEKQQREVQEMLTKLEEAKNMEAEEKAKLEEEIRLKQSEIEDIMQTVNSKEEETRILQEEVNNSKKLLEESAEALQKASLAREEEIRQQAEEKVRLELEKNRKASTSSSEGEGKEADIPEIIVDPVEEREPEMDANMTADLQELGEQLAGQRDKDNETDDTKSFLENVKKGTDKYKTLREVRKGNTKRRIDSFENL